MINTWQWNYTYCIRWEATAFAKILVEFHAPLHGFMFISPLTHKWRFGLNGRQRKNIWMRPSCRAAIWWTSNCISCQYSPARCRLNGTIPTQVNLSSALYTTVRIAHKWAMNANCTRGYIQTPNIRVDYNFQPHNYIRTSDVSLPCTSNESTVGHGIVHSCARVTFHVRSLSTVC